MRYLVACRYLREKDGQAYIYEEVFPSMSDCLVWLHNKYNEARDTREPYFHWVIFDFQSQELYSDQMKTLKEVPFIERIIDLKEMSKFLKVVNS